MTFDQDIGGSADLEADGADTTSKALSEEEGSQSSDRPTHGSKRTKGLVEPLSGADAGSLD